MSGTATPNKKPSAADPSSTLAKDVDARSHLVPIIVGIIVAVMVVVGLIAVLSKDPADAEALMASQQLIDAYLNDPYLERN